MGNLAGFDANEIDPSVPLDPVPAGDYVAMIVESDDRETANGNGHGLNLVWQIQEGQHKGRKLYQWLNIQHENEQAQLISRSEMSAVCRAVGVMTPGDSSELHDKPCILKVGVQKRRDTGEMQNRIKGVSAMSGGVSQAGSPAASNKPAASAPGGAPWKK